MPSRLLKFAELDYQMVFLNMSSVGALVASYVSESLTGWGGFVLLMSIAFLNVAKGISTLKHGNKKKK
ncbi:MAG: hypothetical protein KUG81_02160 [Gammaproteobacteria bacterium]|nr:hypothetical protein [Gammaproteobacteria bacterium]